MKKIICILVAGIFMTANSYGQNNFTISWLTSETMATAYGYGSGSGTLGAFMEFYEEDILNFDNQMIQIDSIKEIMFHLTSISSVSSCRVIIMQGNSIDSAVEVMSQTVSTNNLIDDWNTVILTIPYKVDTALRLYIGYEISLTAGYPLSVSNGTNAKQAWIITSAGSANIIDDMGSSYTCLIKAIVSTMAIVDNEIMLSSLEMEPYVILGDSMEIKGTVRNNGILPLTSFKLSYEVDGISVGTDTITGINVPTNMTYSFSHSKYFTPDSTRTYDLKIIVSEPNDSTDVESNNEMSITLGVFTRLINKVVLHEVFTSSTCGPCYAGNYYLDNVLNHVEYDDWACVKYQYSFPGTGDPYYTAECGTRATFYGGVNSVPSFFGDGTLSMNPSSYTVNNFNTLAAVRAGASMTGTSTMDSPSSKTISLRATITPVMSAATSDNSNLRFFAAIVEKRTVNNVKSNGETEFHYVLKKFMTGVNGDKLGEGETTGLVLDEETQVNYSYTFNGDYRLPSNAGSPINHSTEHSVEIFQNLMVVYWLQDIVTKEVYQAGKAEPYEGTIVNIVDRETQNVIISVFPNPATDQLNIISSVPFSKISIVNMLGQTVKEIEVGTENHVMNVSDMAKGLYILKVDTLQGSTTKKIQIK